MLPWTEMAGSRKGCLLVHLLKCEEVRRNLSFANRFNLVPSTSLHVQARKTPTMSAMYLQVTPPLDCQSMRAAACELVPYGVRSA